ncbi:hypothetical protein J2S74_000732 [Evansella vedderi]|uniref:PD-(D/E)XK motif protein n=1 Tax=Evansella vedderi TaxID=38282 RepID=A0ABT9ZT60_9BACI|nr:PD-(D/E)XK motif protein [Evansella vedderi]MDQ0253360.1 hypothetical protein [Evansella vedderi]
MDRIRLIFQELVEENTTNKELPEEKLKVRLLEEKVFSSMILALTNSHKRMLIMSVPRVLDEQTLKKLPVWNGLRIYQKKLRNPYKNKIEWFVIFEQQMASATEVYEALISDIYRNLLSTTSFKSMFFEIKRTLEKWHNFFVKNQVTGLSIEQQQGLFGELKFIQFLLKNDASKGIIDSWYGPDKDLTDFHFGEIGVEVKTANMSRPLKVSISKEDQLELRGFQELFLQCYFIEKSKVQGESLNSVINEILVLLEGDPNRIDIFNKKLFQAGYHHVHYEMYEKTRFVISEVQSYRVEDGFPNINLSSLPQGVFNVKYQILMESCSEYQIDENELFSTFREHVS